MCKVHINHTPVQISCQLHSCVNLFSFKLLPCANLMQWTLMCKVAIKYKKSQQEIYLGHECIFTLQLPILLQIMISFQTSSRKINGAKGRWDHNHWFLVLSFPAQTQRGKIIFNGNFNMGIGPHLSCRQCNFKIRSFVSITMSDLRFLTVWFFKKINTVSAPV